jgi:type II secretory pathway pseudopilin PulG
VVRRRSAFTLIELIFSIVIMAITVISLPMIMDVDSRARDKNLAQEAVLAASAKLSQVLTYQWDERSLSWDDLAENHQTFARILDGTSYSTTAFDRNGTILRQSGGHRAFFPAITNATPLGDDNATLDAFGNQIVVGMDDRNMTAAALSGFEAGFSANSEGYKRNYRIQVDILRIHDALSPAAGTVDYNQTNLTGNNRFIFSQTEPVGIGAGQNTNMRCAKISILDDTGDLITTLYGYAANIGEYQVHKDIR